MAQDPIVAIGASAGGLPVLKTIVGALPRGFPAAVLVVLHMPPQATSNLPHILSRASALKVVSARDRDAIEPSRIYCAVPNSHLLVDKRNIAVKHGPTENRFRPSIDALFRSAAYNHGRAVIGVVLSGALNDGISGLWTIKYLGGTTIVQSPEEALHPSMPESALAEVDVDHCVTGAEIAPLLTRLVAAMKPSIESPLEDSLRVRVKREIDIASGSSTTPKEETMLGTPSPFACPECHGTLNEIEEGKFRRYRCHVGHAYSAQALLDAITDSIEIKMDETKRALQEAAMLLDRLADDIRHHDQAGAKTLKERSVLMNARAQAFTALLNQDAGSGDTGPSS